MIDNRPPGRVVFRSGFDLPGHLYRVGAIGVAVLVPILAIIAFALVGYWVYTNYWRGPDTANDSITYTVQRRSVSDTVIERGTLESQNNFRGSCNLPGWENKIIFIVPEGKTVSAGETVVKFDSSEIDKLIADKKIAVNEAQGKLDQAKQDLEVQKDKNESDIAAATLELTLAKLDLEKYRDGDFKAEAAELERSIAEGQAELEKVSEELANVRSLVRKGFRSPEQLREYELRAKFRQFQLERDKQKQMVLVKYDYNRKITDLQAKSIESDRKLARAKTTATAQVQKHESLVDAAQNALGLQQESLKELEETLSKCEIKAPTAGTVAYANSEWFDNSERIREGATVRRQQDIFYLPDMTKMQVKVRIHESVINKVKPEQTANVRVDAFPDVALPAKVQNVSELATTSFSDTKNYDAIVMVEKIPDGISIKPGMTAQVEIFIGEYADIVAVPITAVTEHFKQSYVYRMDGSGFKRRPVQLGRVTHSFIEITDGVAEGDKLALDAYQRGLDDFSAAEKDAELETKRPVAPKPEPPPTASPGPPPG